MIFKLTDCDVGVTVDGVNYDFTHVVSVTIEDPEQTNLTRGSNAGNKVGISYKEGVREPKTITVPVIDIPMELHAVLATAYDEESRLQFYAVSRRDGSSCLAKNAVLGQKPLQLTMDDTADSMQVALIFRSFDLTQTHKS